MNTSNVRHVNWCSKLSKIAALAALLMCASTSVSWADGINTNNALTPADGQIIFRSQLRVTELAAENPDVQKTRYIVPLLVAYGLHERFALIAVLPTVAVVGYEPNVGGRKPARSLGLGDGKLLGKARIFTRDGIGKTFRLSALAGVEIPSYDAPFSSESFDPLGGLTLSLKNLDQSLDVDATYKANTADNAKDVISYNAAYTRTLSSGQSLDESFWQLNAIVELNALSVVRGENSLALSPGLQLALPELIVELSYLAPVVRPQGPMPTATSTLVMGMRRFW